MADGLGTQIVEIDVAAFVTGHGHDRQPGNHGTCRIGPVSRNRNQTGRSSRVSSTLVIRADHQQSGIFTLRPGVGLERDARQSRHVRQPLLQFLEELAVSCRLFGRRKRMNATEFRPRYGKHFHRRVEFHGAGAQGNHGMDQRQVSRLQPIQVAQEFMFSMILMKDFVSQKGRGASKRCRQRDGERVRRFFSRQPQPPVL